MYFFSDVAYYISEWFGDRKEIKKELKEETNRDRRMEARFGLLIWWTVTVLTVLIPAAVVFSFGFWLAGRMGYYG